uniref:exosome complex component RRP45 n=1 Tax=Ciona intestinalis TaxID=7719 RepID=UPI000180B7A0|nr:exosome complex component RRP45 [Ciona intestinalis]|eukprot:XP_002123693.1 exosome complex component RRP45 [Ciona intestinalis]
MPMRDVAFSKREHEFVVEALTKKIRIDGRGMLEYRGITIHFSLDHGCCVVNMGGTKVMAQVAAELCRPRESRQSEGSLGVQVEMSMMAAPHLDPAKPGDSGAELQQMLERSIVMSQAVDLEELCVRVGEKSWNIQIFVHVLSHDGNLLDCATIASMTSLKHFKRPDVSVVGQEVTIHKFEDKHPIPLTLHHVPFCVSFAFFQGGGLMVVDPTLNEEKVMDGKLMVAVNKHKEVCCLQMNGQLQLSKEQILNCTNIASTKAQTFYDIMETSLENDQKQKAKGNTRSTMMSSRKQETKKPQTIKLLPINNKPNNGRCDIIDNKSHDEPPPTWLTQHDSSTASIGEGLVNTWEGGDDVIKALRSPPPDDITPDDVMSSSDEEVTLMLD